MKIKNKDGVWCDTKLDWGFKTDEEFISSIWNQREAMSKVLKEIKEFIIEYKENYIFKEQYYNNILNKIDFVQRKSNFK
jgi:hypothetical protein